MKKWKKDAGDISILHSRTKNHNHMMYSPWIRSKTERAFCHFKPFFALYLPNNPKNQYVRKILKCLEMSSFYICVTKITIIWCLLPDISCDVRFLRYGAWKTEFLSFWTIFCLFTFPTTWKIKILKKWKKYLEIYYTCVP